MQRRPQPVGGRAHPRRNDQGFADEPIAGVGLGPRRRRRRGACGEDRDHRQELDSRGPSGTDAHRVASYNPFTSLQWFLDGRTVGGTAIRGPEETPDRAGALRFYTIGSAWFSFDEKKRGSLEVGKYADLAVLSKDYMTVPVEQVHTIESVLTMVGGKVVYSKDDAVQSGR